MNLHDNRIVERLPKELLQKLIGEPLLEQLNEMLPILERHDGDDLKIYRKSTLANIFLSFLEPKSFNDDKFLSSLLLTLTQEEINQLIEKISFKPKGDDFESIAKEISQLGKKAKYSEKIIRFLGFSEKFLPEKRGKTNFSSVISPPTVPFKSLKEYQSKLFFEAISHLKTPNARFILQMPTGSGKTRTAMEIVASTFCEQPKCTCIVWIAHSEELCEQAVECFEQVWVHLGNKTIEVVRGWGGGKIVRTSNNSVFFVCTFQKLYSATKRSVSQLELLKDGQYLVVVDEAHKSIAPTFEETIQTVLNWNSRLIGLTATPGRSIAMHTQNKLLSDLFFQTIVAIHPPNGQSAIYYLRELGVLSSVTFEPLITNIRFTLDEKQKDHLSKFLDFPVGFLKKIGENQTRNLEIIRRMMAALTENSSIIFFACSIEQSKFICSTLNFLGIEAAHVDGNTPKGKRNQLLQAFKTKKLAVISNYGVLTTGFDAPQTDVVFIARPTTSIVLYSQMIGRGLRGKSIGGTSFCKVITVRDNIIGLPSESEIFDYFDEYFTT